MRKNKLTQITHRFPIIEELTKAYPARNFFIVQITDDFIVQNSKLVIRVDETEKLIKYREFYNAVLFEKEPAETNKRYISWRFQTIYTPVHNVNSALKIKQLSNNDYSFSGKSINFVEEHLLKFNRLQRYFSHRSKHDYMWFLSRLIRLDREVLFHEN